MIQDARKVVRKMNSLSTAKKASLALIFAKFFQKGILMISTPVFTRLMTTDEYGIITNFTSWQNITIIIATLNLSQGVFNNGMLDYRDDRDSFTASILILANFCTLIYFGLYIILYNFLSPIIGLSKPLMGLMFLYIIFYPAYSYWSSRQRYEFKYKLLTLYTIIIAVLQMIIGIFAVIRVEIEQQALAKITATEGVLIIVASLMYIYIFIKARFKIKFEYIKYAFSFNVFLIPHFLAMNVLASGDKIMITSMVGRTETAIYGVSYTAASVILIFWQAIEASWTPWLFEHLNSGDRKPIKRRGNQIITAFAVISICCMLFAPEIMSILASTNYMEGIYIIPSVTAGVYFTAVYALYMRVEYYSKKVRATMVGSVSVAIVNVVLNYVFIKMFGYVAAGYTTLICYILLYVFHFWYSRKIGMKEIYNDKYIAVLSVGMIAVSLIVTATYRISIIRYAVIVGLIIMGFSLRKKVIDYIKDILE